MPDRLISIANDFSKFPGGRWRKDGPYSGQEFRETLLAPALLETANAAGSVVVSLDGVAGYGSSFLEETFGGLVRSEVVPPDVIRKKLKIQSSDSVFAGFLQDALRYLRDALNAASADVAA